MRDLLIAGGGPAGLATALYARRAGLRVMVVEPRAGPIDKACGEGLLPPAVATLAELGIRPPGPVLRGIRYRYGDACAEARFRDGTGLGVRRTQLHAALADAARTAGVEICSGAVDAIEQDDSGVRADGIRARYLVAADGLHSRIRRLVDPSAGTRRPGRRRWGTRAHLPVAPWTDFVEVHWAPDPQAGEAYVTPIGPDCVGVAVLGGRGGPFAGRLAAFPTLAERLGDVEPGPVLGAGPLRQRVGRRVNGRVLLVGDAAGYVDALTGEGLALAFACARAAVARIVAGDVARYERDYRDITRRYRWLTAALLGATARPVLRRHVVPLAASAPGVFRAAVGQLAR